MESPPDLVGLQRDAVSADRTCVAGAVIFDAAGRAFVPRRSPAATLPNLWDVVGGHLEPGESIVDALRREVVEETGWAVTGEPALFYVCEWELAEEPGRPRREFDFLVTVAGDLDRPRLAPAEHTEFVWVGVDDLGMLDENHAAGAGLVRRIVANAFAQRTEVALRSPHATLFLTPVAPQIEALRRRWDPVMASQIAAHVTVAYPREIPDLEEMTERVAAVAGRAAPFGLELGAVTIDREPAEGVFVDVRDVDDGWARLRSAMTGVERSPRVLPHVTLVHPRTSGLGAVAWRELAGFDADTAFVARSIAVTAFDGRRWVTTSEHPLG